VRSCLSGILDITVASQTFDTKRPEHAGSVSLKKISAPCGIGERDLIASKKVCIMKNVTSRVLILIEAPPTDPLVDQIEIRRSQFAFLGTSGRARYEKKAFHTTYLRALAQGRAYPEEFTAGNIW
jgi:hypothetical protein